MYNILVTTVIDSVHGASVHQIVLKYDSAASAQVAANRILQHNANHKEEYSQSVVLLF